MTSYVRNWFLNINDENIYFNVVRLWKKQDKKGKRFRLPARPNLFERQGQTVVKEDTSLKKAFIEETIRRGDKMIMNGE